MRSAHDLYNKMAEGSEPKLYKEPAVRPPSCTQLEQIARSLGLDITSDQLQAYREVINRTLSTHYQRVYELPDPKLPVKYPRTPGYRPQPEDNPYNAWYWKIDIRGAADGKLKDKTFAIKDNICVAGVPMMNGSRLLDGYVPDVDATVITRILDAGGHILGKAVCENLCGSGASFTSATGPVINPHDPNRQATGSSSGCAALVAGGHVDVAVGGDQGGSIRGPCNKCGIVGLKPTYGLVPYTGVCPAEYTVDHVGPMARTVYDVALLLEVIAGLDGELDPRQPRDLKVPSSYTAKLDADISKLRIGVVKEGFGHHNSEHDVDAIVRKSCEKIGEKTGAAVEEISIPMHRDGPSIHSCVTVEELWRVLVRGNGFGMCGRGYYVTGLQEALGRGFKSRPDDLTPDMITSALLGKYLTDSYYGVFYSKAQNLAAELCKAYDEKLKLFDVLMMPTSPLKATVFPPGDVSIQGYIKSCGEHKANTCCFNVTGHPALTVNAGFSSGLPVGLMIIGRKFDEVTVLNVARAWERIRDSQ